MLILSRLRFMPSLALLLLNPFITFSERWGAGRGYSIPQSEPPKEKKQEARGNHEEGLTEAKEMQRVAVEEVREFIPLWGSYRLKPISPFPPPIIDNFKLSYFMV